MRYSCISQHHDVHDADDLHGRHAGHGRTIARTTVITVTEFTFRTHRRSGGTIRVRSPCAIFSSAAAKFRDPALHLLQSAEFCSAVRVLIQIAAFQLLLYFSGEFFQRRLPSSSAFGSSTSGIVSFKYVQCCAADDARGSQRTAARASTTRTTGTTDTVNVRLRIHGIS